MLGAADMLLLCPVHLLATDGWLFPARTPLASAPLPLQEHPLLRRPFYMLHPCQTEAIMQLLTNPEDDSQLDGAPAAAAAGSREATGATALPPQAAPAAHGRMLRYLLAWLSVAGQPLGLSPPVELWLQASS